MIIIAYKPGQLANRLFLFAKFLAYGYEHRVMVLNPSFDDYKDYLLSTEKQFMPASNGLQGFSSKLIIGLIYRLSFFVGRVLHRLNINFKFLSVTYLDWSDQYNLESDTRLSAAGLHFIQGWEFNADDLLAIHKKKLIEFFRPAYRFDVEVNNFIQKVKNDNRLIGVHIRHGDYQFFEGGKYFYKLDDYKNLMKALALLHPDLRFVVCTNNREIVLSDFAELNVVMAPGHELTDLYVLAKCNYIMGPPSTYSLWASYYGHVPLYQIKDLSSKVDLSFFNYSR